MASHREIVIVDDDHNLRKAIQARCEATGFCVRGFSDLLDAMRSIAEDPPDLIIFDINMGTGNGLEACEALAGPSRSPFIPLIVMSGDSDAQTRSRARVAGAHFVRKGAHLWERIEPFIHEAAPLAASLQPARTDYRKSEPRG